MSMKLLIAVPTTDYLHADFVKCLSALQVYLNRKRIAYDVEIQAGTLVYFARNRLACKAVNENFTHVLWLDSDMTFNEKVVEDLMFCEKEMVCGAFVSRRQPFTPCVYTCIDEGKIEKVKQFGTQPFRVDGCGFACVLTETGLIRDVQMKYGADVFTPTNYYGEDLAFCWRVKNIGREIWCEPTVRPGHIAHIPVHAGENLFGGQEA